MSACLEGAAPLYLRIAAARAKNKAPWPMERGPRARHILAEFRAALNAMYGKRIERVVLYGSQARGDAQRDSDYDVAVFLNGMNGVTVPDDVYLVAADLYRLGNTTSPRLDHVRPKDVDIYQRRDGSLMVRAWQNWLFSAKGFERYED